MKQLITNEEMSFDVFRSYLLFLLFIEVFLASLWVCFHSLLSRLPSSRTHFTMFISELKGLNKPQCLIHRPAHWKIIYCDLTKISFIINDIQTSECNPLIFFKTTIFF